MISNIIAANYAKALSQLSINHYEALKELDFIWNVINKLHKFNILISENSPTKYKRKIVDALLKSIDISMTIKNLVQILVKNNRLSIINEIKTLYRKNLLEKEIWFLRIGII